MLLTRQDQQVWVHPPLPPFMSATATAVDNPVDAAQAQMTRFFTTWVERRGPPEIATPE
jgi:hypothetical protein